MLKAGWIKHGFWKHCLPKCGFDLLRGKCSESRLFLKIASSIYLSPSQLTFYSQVPSLWHSIPMIQMSLLLYAEHLYDRKLPSSRFSVHWSVRRSQLTTFILLNPFSNDHIYVNLIFNDLLVDLLSAALAVLSCCWSSRLRTSTTWSSPSSPSSPSSMLAFSNIVVVYNWEQQIGDRFNYSSIALKWSLWYGYI